MHQTKSELHQRPNKPQFLKTSPIIENYHAIFRKFRWKNGQKSEFESKISRHMIFLRAFEAKMVQNLKFKNDSLKYESQFWRRIFLIFKFLDFKLQN